MARFAAQIQTVLYGRLARRSFLSAMRLAGAWANWRFERSTRHAAPLNEAVLRDVLLRNRETAFGRTHGFAEILGSQDLMAEYRKRVPLSVYADYEPYLERMAAGEDLQLTADRVVFFAPSSGTTGKAKMIPITKRSAQVTLRALLLSRAVLNRFLPRGGVGRGISLIRMSHDPERTIGGIPTGDASAYGMRQAVWLLPLMYTTPVPAMGIADKPTASFIHALFALRERDLDHVSATFAHYVVQFFRVMEERWPELLESLAAGRLPPQLSLPLHLRVELESQLRPDPSLAAQLRIEFEKGMRGIAQRLWPRFSCIAAVTTGAFELYVPELRKYIGDARLCNLLYGATEAPIGINLDPGRPADYVFIPGLCAVEFIPSDDIDNPSPATVGLTGLQRGECYELVITSHAGFYRYRMDDVVRVTDFYAGSPVLEFAYRRRTILNLAAEKTTEEQVAGVVQQLREGWARAGLTLVDYSAAADVESAPPRYRFFFELGGPSEALTQEFVREAAQTVDTGLVAANVDYAILRRNQGLGTPQIHFLRAGSFQALLDLVREERGTQGDNTLKVPRLISRPAHRRLLESRSVSSSAPGPPAQDAPGVRIG